MGMSCGNEAVQVGISSGTLGRNILTTKSIVSSTVSTSITRSNFSPTLRVCTVSGWKRDRNM